MKRINTIMLVMLCALGAPAAKTDTLTLETTLLPRPMHVQVITPDAAAKGDRFSTVYLLNGYGGDHTSWTTLRPDLPELADRYGMIIVTPDGMDSWYWDAPANKKMKMETYITTQLVPYIDAHYPTVASADRRAITGLSMGGHGALWLSMRHPDIWKNCGSTSGGVNIVPFGTKWKIPLALGAKPTEATLRAHTVATLAGKLKPGQNNIIFDCGVDDFFHKVNSDLHDTMVRLKIPHDYISRPGNHSQKYWANSIIYQLMFFDENFKRAARTTR